MAFKEVDVSTLEDPRSAIMSLTGGAFVTPVVVIDDEVRMGFDPDWMRQRLGLDG